MDESFIISQELEELEEPLKPIGNSPEEFSKKIGRLILKQWLMICLVGAFLLGVVVGVLCRLRKEPYTKREVMYLGFIGSLFMRALGLVAMPLLVISLISSIVHLNTPQLGRLGIRLAAYYLGTTFVAVVIGLALVMIVQPGKGGSQTEHAKQIVRHTTIFDSVLDIFRNILPSNLVEACLYTQITVYVKPSLSKVKGAATTALAGHQKASDAVLTLWMEKSPNLLGIISFTILIAVTAVLCKQVVILTLIVDDLKMVMRFFVKMLIELSPIPIFFIMVSEVVAGQASNLFFQLVWYSLTMIVGLSIHCLIVLPFIYFTITQQNPYKFLFNTLEAIITAFVTSSSLATLFVTIECLEQRNHIPTVITRFVAPLGTSLNMDGSAMHLVIAPLFIGQLLDHTSTLKFSDLVLVCVTATLGSIGTAAVPNASLITMSMVLGVLGINSSNILFIVTVDWVLDRFGTVANIVGDSFGAGVIYHLLNKSELEFLEMSSVNLHRRHQYLD